MLCVLSSVWRNVDSNRIRWVVIRFVQSKSSKPKFYTHNSFQCLYLFQLHHTYTFFPILSFIQMTLYTNKYSELGNNALYINIWSMYTLVVFVVLPLFVLATFNCFLILLVHRSKSVRGDLTNANSIRRTKVSDLAASLKIRILNISYSYIIFLTF